MRLIDQAMKGRRMEIDQDKLDLEKAYRLTKQKQKQKIDKDILALDDLRNSLKIKQVSLGKQIDKLLM